MAPPLSGRDCGRHARSRAGDAAEAADLHERVRARGYRKPSNFFELGLAELLVFHDEIELPPSKLRVKVGGSDAGHNGLRSISSHVGNDYKRVRLGDRSSPRSVGNWSSQLKDVVHRHVLSDFAKSDRPWVEALCEAVADNAALLATDRDSTFQNKVHLAMQAKGFFDRKTAGNRTDFSRLIWRSLRCHAPDLSRASTSSCATK